MVEIADAPQWLLDLLATEEVAPRQADPDIELDTPLAIIEAKHWLLPQPLAAAGNASDTFYRYACRLQDYGLSREKCIELLHDCNPSYDEDDIAQRVINAERHRQNDIGSDRPRSHEEVFADVEPPEPISLIARPYDWWIDREFPPITWLLDGLIGEGMPNLMTGKSKVGKTTFLLNLIAHMLAGRPFLDCKTAQRPVVAFLAEDNYGPIRDHLLAITSEMGLGHSVLERLHLRSILSEPLEDGFLARVDDSGMVTSSRFMREGLVPFLATLENPLLILDPITEFISFNRYAEMSARRMVTGFCNSICRIGNGVTVLLTDHPSIASGQQGRDVAGSVQMEASFPIVTTLKSGDWTEALVRQREMSFQTKFNRHAPEQAPKVFYRIAGRYTFTKDGAPGYTAKDRAVTVYRHVIERLDQDLQTTAQNRGGHGPAEVAIALSLTEDEVKEAFKWLRAAAWLQYLDATGRTKGQFTLGSKGPRLADLETPAPESSQPF